MPLISYVARNFISARILDANSGFNYWIQQVAADYSLPSFQLVNGTNFFQGAITADQIEENSDCTYPLCIVSNAKAINQNLASPNEFFGVLINVIDFYFSWPELPLDSDVPGEMVQDALTETFNNPEYYGISTDPALTYNNELDAVFFPIQYGGTNWRKLVRFTITHRYGTMGR